MLSTVCAPTALYASFGTRVEHDEVAAFPMDVEAVVHAVGRELLHLLLDGESRDRVEVEELDLLVGDLARVVLHEQP
jgi:hypothetical protein